MEILRDSEIVDIMQRRGMWWRVVGGKPCEQRDMLVEQAIKINEKLIEICREVAERQVDKFLEGEKVSDYLEEDVISLIKEEEDRKAP